MRNITSDTLDAQLNWYGSGGDPDSSHFSGPVDFSRSLGAGTELQSAAVGVVPAVHTIPRDGSVWAAMSGLLVPGQTLMGSSLMLEWGGQLLAREGDVMEGSLFAALAAAGQQTWFAPEPSALPGTLRVDQALLGPASAGSPVDPKGVPIAGTFLLRRPGHGARAPAH